MIQSHLGAALLFALVTSIVFAVTSKNTDRDRFLYGAWVFGIFLIVTFGLSWVMRLFQR
jgi:hypothetical protein